MHIRVVWRCLVRRRLLVRCDGHVVRGRRVLLLRCKRPGGDHRRGAKGGGRLGGWEAELHLAKLRLNREQRIRHHAQARIRRPLLLL